MVEIRFLEEENRAAAYDGAREVGECVFEVENGRWNIVHTGVDSAYGGQGIARRLVEAVIARAQTVGRPLGATCTYAQKVLGQSRA